MSFKSIVGLDVLDVLLHFGITAALLGGLIPTLHGEEEIAVTSMVITASSLVVFGIRRQLALRRLAKGSGVTTGEMNAERMTELESRVAELESAQARVYELEERLDFAERLLSRESGPRALAPGQDRIHE
jgi:hypothetical protein